MRFKVIHIKERNIPLRVIFYFTRLIVVVILSYRYLLIINVVINPYFSQQDKDLASIFICYFNDRIFYLLHLGFNICKKVVTIYYFLHLSRINKRISLSFFFNKVFIYCSIFDHLVH